MSLRHTVLGLLESAPAHGYSLKNAYDAHFGATREIKYGQVYATLGRLERDGLASTVAIEPGEGPDRRNYAITQAGITELEQWLYEAEPVRPTAPSELFVKVTLALVSGRPAAQILDAQRAVYLERLRELANVRRGADLPTQLAADFETAHLKADLDWIETAGQRLERWKTALEETK
ncbi:MAG TPA: PadR family transcriptional regulator [Actinomycetales bacterium]|nr:PadR family transcriptional regulator [Actinomycetales bacterium]